MTRIVDWKVLKTIIPYSRQHVQRLEDSGSFPLRVRLGPHRVGWVETEVEVWLQDRLRQREQLP